MTLKTFLIGMLASFGLAWMCLIAIPAAKMSAIPPVKMNAEDEDAPYYQRMASGRIQSGSAIYGANGCYYCHTQLIRPTYLGRQIWRDDVAGRVDKEEGIDTRRETSYYDYDGEEFARIGLARMGSDLSNFGYRAEKYAAATGMTPEHWVIEHLYNPRSSALFLGDQGQKTDRGWSNCPSQKQMFEEVPTSGQGDGLAISSESNGDTQVIPKEQARVLASYLLSLKRDDEMPDSLKHPVRGADAETEAE
ncbi:MAG: hypothetical protein AB8F34_10760 [Akkermansiaceae bacterium]